MAALRNPGYLLHMASTSCLVMVGAKFRKKIDVVLCKARGLGLPKMENRLISISSLSTNKVVIL